MGPPIVVSDGDLPASPTKTLPYRTHPKDASPNLRSLYSFSAQTPADTEFKEDSTGTMSGILPNSPYLPPTPPGAKNGDISRTADENISDVTMFRSALVTPINQQSPPTPDNTPPREANTPLLRPFLGTQPSITSTAAESFKTAREDLDSEYDSDTLWQDHMSEARRPSTPAEKAGHFEYRLRRACMPRSPLVNTVDGEDAPSDQSRDYANYPCHNNDNSPNAVSATNEEDTPRFQASPISLSHTSIPIGEANGEMISPHQDAISGNILANGNHAASHGKSSASYGLRRDKSLRDRLLEAREQHPSASTERFADIIGWNDSVATEHDSPGHSELTQEESRRLSQTSATSTTIGAIVVEPTPLPRRRTTLRHVNKHESLRSISSPLPTSNRNSLDSSSDSPRRLVHKVARLSNQNRWSFGSEVSRSYSLASSAALPKMEIIRVAVIPERNSSLSSSHNASNRQSLSAGSAQSNSRRTSDNPPSSWQHKNPFSESLERGRAAEQGPPAPARNSSLSAPTSRVTSRANSTSSENLRVRRQQAEKDLRKTLDRMESERLVQNMHEWGLGIQTRASGTPKGASLARASFGQSANRSASLPATLQDLPHTGTSLGLAVPGSNEWAALRPPSVLETPFSQPSFQSASPEINEAQAINFFPHNNHSLQLIEPFPIPESKAVREVQRENLPLKEVESPLRNPRRPPEPPKFQVIPPTPADEINNDALFGPQTTGRTGSVRRPRNAHRHSESLVDALSRNLSLKNARNRKANQELDGKLHPFWRPRAFWDDIDVARPELGPNPNDRRIVSNSLGLPQERTIITGPVSLVRRISERRRQKRGIVKQSSHGSLARLRAGRRIHKSDGLGLRLHLISIKDIQDRLFRISERREDEKRERRRAQLRRSIGPNVISQGDSRFPASNIGLSMAA